MVRNGMIRVLEHAGFGADAVPNGLAGLSAARDGTYAAIICDLRLPFLEGHDFYTQLQEHLPHLTGRVVFVTGWAKDEKAREFLESTGQPFLGKPYEINELMDAVRKVAVTE